MNDIPEVEFNAGDMLTLAREETGLNDFGDDHFMPAFEVLVEALDKEAQLNPIGRITQYQRILNSLKNRARMEEWFRRHPEIEQEVVAPPVVIVGLARTGTTMLHRILANDTRFYAPLWYEVRNPSPYMDWSADGTDQRLVEATAEVEALLAANPEFAAIHPMDPLGADEEIMLLEHSFYSYVPNAFAHIPSYTQYVGNSDNAPAYQYLKRQLQFLQWQKKQRGETAERWLLKTPHHLHFMELLLSVFPDAQILATHRDPVLSVPSITSMNYNLWITCSDHADKLAVAKEWSVLFANGMQHTMDVRERRSDQFFDAWFEDTVARPFEVIEQMYQFLHMPMTEQARHAMEQHREANKREDRPMHEYTLEEYGYTKDGIRGLYKQYCEKFIDAKA
ncbi:MAG: sulfotransferase [Pseudomonadales bacterium]